MEAFEYIHNCNRKDIEEFMRIKKEIETRERENNERDKNAKDNDKHSGTNDVVMT